MTLLYATGFENIRDDTDLRAAGWFNSVKGWTAGIPVNPTAIAAGSGQLAGGSALSMLSLASPYTGSTGVMGTAVVNYGWRPLGQTVAQVYAAGGIVFGARVKFNQAAIAARGNFYGQTAYTLSSQSTTDGTRFFCIALINGVYGFQYTADGSNWTALPLPAGVTINSASNIWSMGGLIAIAISGSANFYTTPDLGVTWTTSTCSAGTPSAFIVRAGVITVGNGTSTCMVFATSNTNTADPGPWIGNIGGTFTRFESFPTLSYSPNSTTFYGTQIVHCELRVASLTVTAVVGYPTNFSATSTVSQISAVVGTVYRCVYNANNNKWIACTNLAGGQIVQGANTGTTSNPLLPTSGTWTATGITGLSGTGYAMAYDGGSNFACSTSTGLFHSTDGVTWTAATTSVQTFDPNVAQIEWTGSQFIATTNASAYVTAPGNVTAGSASTYVSPDGIHWTLTSFAELLEGGSGRQALGLMTASATNTAAGTYTSSSATGNCLMLYGDLLSSGNRPVEFSPGQSATFTTLTTVTNSANGGWNYLELDCTPTATANQFNCQAYLNGSAIGALQTVTLTGTNQMLFQLPLGGYITQMDDLYIILKDGVVPNARLGPVNIVSKIPSSDVTKAWIPTVGTDNFAAVNSVSAYANFGNSLTSTTAGTKDVYGVTGPSMNNGFKVKAAFAEVNLAATTTTATVSLGVKSGSAETDGAPVTVTAGAAAATVQTVFANDPNTGTTWTIAAANAAQLALIQAS